jgi:hypothetical protein
VGDLELITAGDELTAIPEAAGRFHGHYIYHTGSQSHDPAYNIIHSVKPHKRNVLTLIFAKNKYKELTDKEYGKKSLRNLITAI